MVRYLLLVNLCLSNGTLHYSVYQQRYCSSELTYLSVWKSELYQITAATITLKSRTAFISPQVLHRKAGLSLVGQ
jgi:hypothetical protein